MRGRAGKGFRESDAIPIKFRLKLRFAPRKDADETKRASAAIICRASSFAQARLAKA
jgi:hypothetical protein